MTASARGPLRPQDPAPSVSRASSSSASADSASRPRRRHHQSALERHRNNLVDVDDASRLIECAQIQRQIRFQGLVRRYISQILYGCTSSHCTTPTCLSCNKRLVTRPRRAPTQLTARALAHFLASQDDPRSGLCPHTLRVAPSTLELGDASTGGFRPSVGGSLRSALNVQAPAKQSPVGKRTKTFNGGQFDRQGRLKALGAALDERHQKKKDVKSLGQNLFDTVAVIWAFSRHLPSPLTAFATLRNGPAPRLDANVVEYSAKNRNVNSPDNALTRHAHGLAITAQANGAPTTMRQHSQGHQTVTRKPPTPRTSPEATDIRSRVHKFRHHLPESMSGRRTSFKANESISFDGTRETMVSPNPGLKQKSSISDVRRDVHKFDPPVLVSLTPKSDATGASVTKMKEPLLPVFSHLDCDIMEDLKEDVYDHRNEQPPEFAFAIDYDKNGRYRPTKPFVNRSLFYTLSDPEILLRSFRDTDNNTFKDSPLPHLNSSRLVHAFRDWNHRNGALIFDSLWIAVEALFTPPPELDVQKSPHLKASKRTPSMDSSPGPSSDRTEPKANRYLRDEEAAHIVMICIHALTSLVPVGWPHCWVQLRKFRSWGIILPDAPPQTDFTDGFADPWLKIIDELEYEPALRLADRLTRGIGARICFAHIMNSLEHERTSSESDPVVGHNPFLNILLGHLQEVERLALADKKKMKTSLSLDEDPGWTVTSIFLEWLRTIIIKKWDGKAVVNRWSNVGTAAFLFSLFNANRRTLNLRKGVFHMPYLNERIDAVNEPIEFMRSEIHPNSMHLFYFPCLFPPDYLVAYFRTINFTTMLKMFEQTERTVQLQRDLDPFLRAHNWQQIRQMLKVTFSDFLVLNVPREGVLEQTLNQLWGHEKRLLLKPLKVKMGLLEGEVGLDQGGVTYEFFRIALNEAFKPDTGMFTVDPETRMTWFQPASLEPDWKFEMLGLLFSLAVYNGITLPVTFPIALYRNLLGPDHLPPYPNSTDFIKDGWPRLARSFDELLAWNQGDVADIFLRSYSFSFEAFGQNIDVDMQAFDRHPNVESRVWPAGYKGLIDAEEALFGPTWPLNLPRPPHDNPGWERPMSDGEDATTADDSPVETPLVTNANRDQFVADYIFWLTYKSVAPQFIAFRKGFRTCLQDKSLYLFDPYTLRSLVEGTQEINVHELQANTRYEDGFTATHSTIVTFWSIIEKYSLADRRKLLEFVTASDRVPITGYESMNFIIARNGPDTENLPTSSTCFGKLMLPEYNSKEKMKRKLDLAIQNSKGFGVV